MKLIYIANSRLPTEKAYGIQISKTCEAMANLGVEVFLLSPFRFSQIKGDFFNYHGIKRNFTFRKVFVLDFYLPGFLNKIAFGVKSFYSAVVLVFFALTRGADLFYTRDELVAYFLSFFKKNVVFEGHKFSDKRKIFYSRFKKINLKIVVISQGLKNEFIKFGIKEQNMLVARDGVDLDLFNIDISKEEARKKCNLPTDKKVIMYTGHLFEWKGAHVLLEVALNDQFSIINNHLLFVFVGGTEHDIKEFKKKAKGLKNVLILGHKHYDQLPFYLKAADILILPNSAKEEISQKYTSPLKLFEYMASVRPIVASDLPSLREVLSENNAVLITPDNPDSLAEGIKKILNKSELGDKISHKARSDVEGYTWQKRAEKIKTFLILENKKP